MRLLITIIFTIFLSLITFAQSNIVFVFNYDSTKVYVKYDSLKPYLTADNKELSNPALLKIKNDTLVLNEYFTYLNQKKDSSRFDLDKELFAAINNKKATITYNGKTITSFYKKMVKKKSGTVLHFKGYYYYDTITKKQFITETLYQKHYCMPGSF